MVQILYQALGGMFIADLTHGSHQNLGDHEARARALAAVIPGSNCSPVKITTGIQKPGLDTLIYWGHGAAMGVCGLTPQEFAQDVVAWKRWNSGIKTVEVITCDARHVGLCDLSFIETVRPLIRKKYKDIVIKALPMGMGSSSAHTFSTLLAHSPTGTWCYITAGGAQEIDELMPAVHLVKTEATQNTGGDLSQAAQAVQAANPARKFGLMFGGFANLRDTLTVIH